MRVGISYDLKSDFHADPSAPEDRLEEYDSLTTVDAIAEALRANGYEPVRVGGGRSFLERVLRDPPDLVFNFAEGYGTRSREAHVPAVLEMLGIPFTHSDPLTLAVTLDKAMAKQLASAASVPTPAFTVIARPEQLADVDLAYPLFVKPLFEGSSMGIRNRSRVETPAALAELVGWLLDSYQQPVLVEEYCPGPEFTVGILGCGADAQVIGVMEIAPRCAPLDQFVYSLEVKRNYLTEVEYHVPPKRPASLVAAIERVALGAYRALGCRDISRVDVRVGSDGEPKFLEVNPLPGLHPITGDVVILSERSGLPYAALISRIVESARARHGM